MLVCHCNVVSDRAIRAAVAGGVCDIDGVADRCGAGRDCGGCIPGIEALLAEAAMAFSDPAGMAELQAERRLAREPASRDRQPAGVGASPVFAH